MFNSRMQSSLNLKRRLHEGDGSTRPAKSLRQTVQKLLGYSTNKSNRKQKDKSASFKVGRCFAFINLEI